MDPSTIEFVTQLYKLGGIGALIGGGMVSALTWYLKNNVAEQRAMREEMRHLNRLLLAMMMDKTGVGNTQEIADFIMKTEQRELGK